MNSFFRTHIEQHLEDTEPVFEHKDYKDGGSYPWKYEWEIFKIGIRENIKDSIPALRAITFTLIGAGIGFLIGGFAGCAVLGLAGFLFSLCKTFEIKSRVNEDSNAILVSRKVYRCL